MFISEVVVWLIYGFEGADLCGGCTGPSWCMRGRWWCREDECDIRTKNTIKRAETKWIEGSWTVQYTFCKLCTFLRDWLRPCAGPWAESWLNLASPCAFTGDGFGYLSWASAFSGSGSLGLRLACAEGFGVDGAWPCSVRLGLADRCEWRRQPPPAVVVGFRCQQHDGPSRASPGPARAAAAAPAFRASPQRAGYA